MSETVPVAARALSPEELTIAARLIWGTRFDGGSEGLAEFLHVGHRNALKFMSGEKAFGLQFSAIVLHRLEDYIATADTPAARVIRMATRS
jgi:hypothetical protein